MVVAYFVIDLTIKLKNKNDDLLVKTLVATDQAIIYNVIMRDLNVANNIDCNYINSKLTIDSNKKVFTFGDFKNIVSEYATIGNYTCINVGGNSVEIKIPLSVPQLPDDDFDVDIKFIKNS